MAAGEGRCLPSEVISLCFVDNTLRACSLMTAALQSLVVLAGAFLPKRARNAFSVCVVSVMATFRSLSSLVVAALVRDSTSSDFTTCYVEHTYRKGCDTVTDTQCQGCDWNGSPNPFTCSVPCQALCQNGQAEHKDGSDPSCHPTDGEWPGYMEDCKAWNYQLGKDGIPWTRPYDFETYVEISNDDDGLKRMCLGPGSISFSKPKFPCAIHQSADMITCSSGGPWVDDNTTKFDVIMKAFQAKMAECEPAPWSQEYCVVDAEGIEESGPVRLAISIGHGVLDGVCGSIALMKYAPPSGWQNVDCKHSEGACKDDGIYQRRAPTGFGEPRYMINLQAGMRSWSGEFKSFAYLAPDNAHGSACDVPLVKTVDWQTVQGWLTQKSYKVSCGMSGCS